MLVKGTSLVLLFSTNIGGAIVMNDQCDQLIEEGERRLKEDSKRVREFRLFQRALIWLISQTYPNGVEASFCEFVFDDVLDTLSGFLILISLPTGADGLEKWEKFLGKELKDGWVKLVADDKQRIYICPTSQGVRAVERLRPTLPETWVGNWVRLLNNIQHHPKMFDTFKP